VVQPLERYRHGWIAYSLGNFVFDQKDPLTRRGLMLKVKVRNRQITEVIPLHVIIGPTFQPALATEGVQGRGRPMTSVWLSVVFPS